MNVATGSSQAESCQKGSECALSSSHSQVRLKPSVAPVASVRCFDTFQNHSAAALMLPFTDSKHQVS